MYLALLFLSVLLAVGKSSIYNFYAKSESPNTGSVFLFNAISYGMAALLNGFSGMKSVSLPTVVCAMLYAAIVFSLQTLSVRAMAIGPMSLTSLAVLYGMIIPSLAGPVFWKEPFGITQLIGIVLSAVSLWLLREENVAERKIGRKWGALAVLCFLLSGFAGLMEKIHQSTDGKEERSEFILLACSLMLLFSVVGMLLAGKRHSHPIFSQRMAVCGLLCGVIVGVYSGINLTLAGALDSMIYYPVANGGALLCTVLVSLFVFKEQADFRRKIGLLTGLAAILLLSIPV